MKKKKIFLLYPYYWPLYKAGGPVQSLFNLSKVLKNHADIYCLSLNKDIASHEPEGKLKLNTWNSGPNAENIFYTSSLNPLLLVRLIREVQPDVLMINGIFHWHTSLAGLAIGIILRIKTVISPRGMLQEWALRRGRFKKLLFLRVFKMLMSKDEIWHAADEQENMDIKKIFGIDQRIFVASNIPRPLFHFSPIQFPNPLSQIKLVFLSLINSNKNLHLIIDSVNSFKGKFALDIYGPIIDKVYWQNCLARIEDASLISYRGPISPWEVPRTLQRYHFFVLPTLGENFGHAIFDALSSGVPVLISKHTPWKEIEEQRAGMYINLENENSIPGILNSIVKMTPHTYSEYRSSAYHYAQRYLDSMDFVEDYSFLWKDN